MLVLQLLRRKDAFSIIVAIVVGLSLALFVSTVAMAINVFLEQLLDRSRVGTLSFDWRTGILNPLVAFGLQIALLELVVQAGLQLRNLTHKAFTKSEK